MTGDKADSRVVVRRDRLLDERLPCVGELNDCRERFGLVLSVLKLDVKLDTQLIDGSSVPEAAKVWPTSSDSSEA